MWICNYTELRYFSKKITISVALYKLRISLSSGFEMPKKTSILAAYRRFWFSMKSINEDFKADLNFKKWQKKVANWQNFRLTVAPQPKTRQIHTLAALKATLAANKNLNPELLGRKNYTVHFKCPTIWRFSQHVNTCPTPQFVKMFFFSPPKKKKFCTRCEAIFFFTFKDI